MEREIITGIVALIVGAVCLAIAGPWPQIADDAEADDAAVGTAGAVATAGAIRTTDAENAGRGRGDD